jgi:hypothetical protein
MPPRLIAIMSCSIKLAQRVIPATGPLTPDIPMTCVTCGPLKLSAQDILFPIRATILAGRVAHRRPSPAF